VGALRTRLRPACAPRHPWCACSTSWLRRRCARACCHQPAATTALQPARPAKTFNSVRTTPLHGENRRWRKETDQHCQNIFVRRVFVLCQLAPVGSVGVLGLLVAAGVRQRAHRVRAAVLASEKEGGHPVGCVLDLRVGFRLLAHLPDRLVIVRLRREHQRGPAQTNDNDQQTAR